MAKLQSTGSDLVLDLMRSGGLTLSPARQDRLVAKNLDYLAGMPMAKIDQSTLDALKQVSTPTVATLLYKRGLRCQTIQGVLPLGPIKQSMVGIAFTLRYIPAREDLNQISVFLDPKHPQRDAIEACPPGAVLVIDSRGDARAASAGSILVRRLMMRGVAGVVTDGGLRDSAEISTFEMPTFHQRPSAPTNLTLHQAIDVNVPIGCGGAPVFPGDVIIGDADGVIVIPAGIAADIAKEATAMTLFEDFVIDMVSQGQSTIGLYPMTDPKNQVAFDRWRAAKIPGSSPFESTTDRETGE